MIKIPELSGIPGLIILLVIFLRCGANDNEPGNGLYTRTIHVNDVDRKYAVYIPKDRGNLPSPAVFVLHGGGGNIENMTGENGYKAPFKLWMNIADTANIIVIYPQGSNGLSGKPTWNDCRENCLINSDADDTGFISALIDMIHSEFNIDTERIYVTGFSNGAIMSLRLAVELPGKMAAVAAVGGAMPDVSECIKPSSPVSVLFMNGTNDKFLPYTGGTIGHPPNPEHGTVFSTGNTVKIWININQTDTIPVSFTFPDLDTDDGGIVEKTIYSNGLKGTEVVLYKVEGGGHLAPSIQEQYSNLTEKIFGKQNHDIEMVVEVWSFFRNKRLN